MDVNESYNVEEDFIKLKKLKRDIENPNQNFQKYFICDNSTIFEKHMNTLKQTLIVQYNDFHHFKLRQVLWSSNSTTIIPITLKYNESLADVIAVGSQNNKSALQFYRWNAQFQKFLHENQLSDSAEAEKLDKLWSLGFHEGDWLNAMHSYVQNENIKEIKISNNFMESLRVKKQPLVSLTVAESTCFAVYSNETQEVLINCLIIDVDGAIEIYTKEAIQKNGVKQILQLNINKIALLLNENIEIWSVKEDIMLIQTIPVMNPQQIVQGTHNNMLYLAAIEEHTTNTSEEGTINIFKSLNGSNFVRLQSLNCMEPQQILFSNIKESNDLILYVLRNATNPTLIAYQLKGDVGFKTVLGVYMLSPAKQMQNIQFTLDPKYFIALYGKDDITIIEAKF